MADIGPEDVLHFIYDKEEARYTDLINAFVGKHCAKQTLLNYKKELEAKGLIDKKISDKTKRPVYYIPPEKMWKVSLLVEKRVEKAKIDRMDPEEFQEKMKRDTFNRQLEEYNTMLDTFTRPYYDGVVSKKDGDALLCASKEFRDKFWFTTTFPATQMKNRKRSFLENIKRNESVLKEYEDNELYRRTLLYKEGNAVAKWTKKEKKLMWKNIQREILD